MKYNLHTHTYLCHHAKGTPREYIERAIAEGITSMGFSDHAPFAFPDGYQTPARVPMERGEEYMTMLRSLREEYRDRIDLYIGFEMEYYPLYFKDMLRIVTELGAEYLILGEHYVKNEHPGDNHYLGKVNDSEEELVEYADTVAEGMGTGLFTYVAHPDLFNFQGDPRLYEEQMRKLCRASVRYDVPLEINCLGIRDHRNYPDPVFWRIAGEEGCSAVIGFDAHTVRSAYDAESIPIAEAIARQNGLRLVERPGLVDPKTGRKYEI